MFALYCFFCFSTFDHHLTNTSQQQARFASASHPSSHVFLIVSLTLCFGHIQLFALFVLFFDTVQSEIVPSSSELTFLVPFFFLVATRLQGIFPFVCLAHPKRHPLSHAFYLLLAKGGAVSFLSALCLHGLEITGKMLISTAQLLVLVQGSAFVPEHHACVADRRADQATVRATHIRRRRR